MRWEVNLFEFDLDIQHQKDRKSAKVGGITRHTPTRERHVWQGGCREYVRHSHARCICYSDYKKYEASKGGREVGKREYEEREYEERVKEERKKTEKKKRERKKRERQRREREKAEREKEEREQEQTKKEERDKEKRE